MEADMRLMMTEKRKFNYLVLAFLMVLATIWSIKIYHDGLVWPF
jgi:hypothetical protein